MTSENSTLQILLTLAIRAQPNISNKELSKKFSLSLPLIDKTLSELILLKEVTETKTYEYK